MKEIIVRTQEEMDAIKEIKVDECVIVESDLKLNCELNICGKIIIKVNLACDFFAGFKLMARESSQPRVEAWESSQPTVVAWGSSQPTVVAWGSSQPRVEARESSQPRVEAWESSQPTVVAWGSSQPTVVAWGSSQPRVEAWESSQPRVEARESSQPRVDYSNCSATRDDLWAVLCNAPSEVEGLRQAIIDGKIDGSTYCGECACLVGTIANVRGCKIENLGILKRNVNRPAEQLFLQIKIGDIPEKNPSAKLALQWINEWLFNMKTTFSKGVKFNA